jgi:saccharopine dehydrogenase (NAD+, L-lysine-forming)
MENRIGKAASLSKADPPAMRMMLVGAGAVGECILKVLKKRDPKADWLEYVLIVDYDSARAAAVARKVQDFGAPGFCVYESAQADARSVEALTSLIRQRRITFVMDAASPFVSNFIFDAAFAGGADYASMGTWSVPKKHPAFGFGFEGSYEEPMTKYNFDRHEAWREKGQMACICLGIDPGVVNVFAKYAAEYLFDQLFEVHVKDGGNLCVPGASPDTVQFGFNVWTVLDEVLNPNAEWFLDQGFLLEDAFAGREIFRMPEPFGENTLVKVEHEEVVTLPRYLSSYGLKRASFKISLDESLIHALRLLNSLGLRSTEPVLVNGVPVIPRDVVAVCAPQPGDIGREMTGGMCVGVHCIGKKDGQRQEYFLYQPFDNQQSLKDWDMQAVAAQTGFGAALALELMGRGIWKDAGVFSPEYFPSLPYIRLMEEAGLEYRIARLPL